MSWKVSAVLVTASVALAGCGAAPSTVTVTEPNSDKSTTTTTTPEDTTTTTTEVDAWAGTKRCAKLWNAESTDKQLKDVALAALINPIRRDQKATAWVDGWTFQEGEVALIGPGQRGRTVQTHKGQCLVALGPDTGLVYLRIGRKWLQISGDAPTEPAYPAVMMAKSGGNSYVRRDGTVLPIAGWN